MTRSTPGIPSLLREMNDSAVLKHIMLVGEVTRAELAAHTGLSRVTSSQALSRLDDLGLVCSKGRRAGARGPAADLYAMAPRVGAALGMALLPTAVRADLVSLTGHVLASASLPLEDDPLESCVAVAHLLVDDVGAEAGPIHAAVMAVPGVVDPATGDLVFSYDLADSTGIRGALATRIGAPFRLGNDIHLAALAEAREGIAGGHDDFVMIWLGRGVGMASVVAGRVRAGHTGAAGEIGYLPVPGVPLPHRVDNLEQGSFQRLVGASAIRDLAERLGVQPGTNGGAEEVFIAELAERISLGVASVGTILDPALVVLSGETTLECGPGLPQAVMEATSRIAPISPRVAVSSLGIDGPLVGARMEALDTARQVILERVKNGT